MLLTAINNDSFTLGSGLDDFRAVYMPAHNYSNCTREECSSGPRSLKAITAIMAELSDGMHRHLSRPLAVVWSGC